MDSFNIELSKNEKMQGELFNMKLDLIKVEKQAYHLAGLSASRVFEFSGKELDQYIKILKSWTKALNDNAYTKKYGIKLEDNTIYSASGYYCIKY